MVVRAIVAALAVAVTGCGDNLHPPVDSGDLIDRLNALPGVTAVVTPTETAGFTYIVLQFTQPVDHGSPGATFQQQASLLHHDLDAPLVVHTSGYSDYYRDSPVELTRILDGNQLSIEHRFFGTSRPEPADWSKLTIEQMANDQHAIITALREIYGAAFITTGGSKGGMTAIYHRRFFPDDVEGTVPYVAPLSLAAPDLRYPVFLDTIGPPTCRQAVRDLATELLAQRRTMVETRATSQAASDGHVYTRIPLGPAVESSISSLEWAFWQYFGVGLCDGVPATTASDDEAWAFLERVSPVSDNDDAQIAEFDAYYHQAYAQLGYPDAGAAYLDPYLQYTDADYEGALPTAAPPYDDGAAMRDIDTWVRTAGDRLLFVYGEWDPWTGGQFELGNAADSLRLTQAQGSHGARISRLSSTDEAAARARLTAWTGVAVAARRAASDPVSGLDLERPFVRVPPAMRRALRTR